MVVELVSVGTELLLGNIVNTNAAYLAEECAALGFSVFYQTVVGDNRERLQETVMTAMKRSDMVILTGGLGPTEDDLTKETVSSALKLPLVEDLHTKEMIVDYFAKRRRVKISQNNWKQALIPQGALVMDNENGTAPGLIIETTGERKQTVVMLPGPPSELKPLFQNKIKPYLLEKSTEIIYSVTVKLCGLGESLVETEIADLIQAQTNPTIATYAKVDEVHLRVTARAVNEESAKQLMKPMLKELRKRFGLYIYSMEEKENLEDVIVKLLREKNMTLTAVESCTGGLFAGTIVNVPGASDVFKQSFVTYSNKAKHRLVGVQKTSLKKHGAVSEKVAREMAKGGASCAKTNVCIAITGIAGPDGGTDEKPVGLVYIACYVNGETIVNEYRFTGNRINNRNSAVKKALIMLRKSLLEIEL